MKKVSILVLYTFIASSVYGAIEVPSENVNLAKQIEEIDQKAALEVYKMLVNERTRLEIQLIRMRWALTEDHSEEKVAQITGGKSYEQIAERREALRKEIETYRENLLQPSPKK